MTKPLKSLLVSCISPTVPRRITLDYIERLRTAGATILLCEGATDVSLSRCLQAESILHRFDQFRDLNYVLWLDDDVATSLECTLALQALCNFANTTQLCSVSGAYVNRHRVNNQTHQELAACVLSKDHPVRSIELTLQGDTMGLPQPKQVILRPALTGLGCLMQPREVFLAHCDASPSFAYGPLVRLIPHVCHSRMLSRDELAEFFSIPEGVTQPFFWQGEDFNYCAREFKQGHPVFLAPIDFAHESRSVLIPDSETVLPGLRREH